MISNLSFHPSEQTRRLLGQIETEHQGISHLNITAGQYPKSFETNTSWGIIPIFQGSMTARDINSFFDQVIELKQPILTIYLDLNQHDLQRSDTIKHRPSVRFGKLMNATQLDEFSSGAELCSFIQSKLRFFEQATRTNYLRKPVVDLNKFNQTCSWSELKDELVQLDKTDKCILKRGKFSLYLTKFEGLTRVPQEVGRLRARTFEEIGEGSGAPIDLDTFDENYYQLFLVDESAKGIVGGYRIGAGDELIPIYDLSGLYTYSLYDIGSAMKDMLLSSIELGRSFVVRSHQKMRMPLFLMWSGILKFIQQKNKYKYVIGNVSISRVYSDVSRSLIINYLKRHHFDKSLSKHFRPRQEYYADSSTDSLENIVKVFNGELIRLDEFIAEIEPDNYRLPVLIRKYINQNARFVGFNLDPSFSNCVDGLMVLDVDQLPMRTIQLLHHK